MMLRPLVAALVCIAGVEATFVRGTSNQHLTSPQVCSDSVTELVEPQPEDPQPEAFPEIVYGNFQYKDQVSTVALSHTHPLREGMFFDKEKPKSTKLQKRFVYVSVTEDEDDQGERDFKMALVYKNKKKSIDLDKIREVVVAKNHFLVHTSTSRNRGGKQDKSVSEYETTFKFVFLADQGKAAATATVSPKEFAHSLKELVASYKLYASQPNMEATSVGNNKRIDAFLMKNAKVAPATLDTSDPDADFIVSWASAARKIAMYSISSPKSLSSVGIDYQRLYTRTEVDGQHCREGGTASWCEGPKDGAGLIQEVFKKYGPPFGMDDTTVASLLDAGCRGSFPIAVLRAGVQNVAIQLEKRMMYLAFNSVKVKGRLDGKPLGGYARDSSVSITLGGNPMGERELKVKNEYAKDSLPAVQITSDQDGKGATVKVTRILGLQHMTSLSFIMRARYDISTKVVFAPSQPIYATLNVDIHEPEFPDSEHKLDAATQGLLTQRLKLLNAAFKASGAKGGK